VELRYVPKIVCLAKACFIEKLFYEMNCSFDFGSNFAGKFWLADDDKKGRRSCESNIGRNWNSTLKNLDFASQCFLSGG